MQIRLYAQPSYYFVLCCDLLLIFHFNFFFFFAAFFMHIFCLPLLLFAYLVAPNAHDVVSDSSCMSAHISGHAHPRWWKQLDAEGTTENYYYSFRAIKDCREGWWEHAR